LLFRPPSRFAALRRLHNSFNPLAC